MDRNTLLRWALIAGGILLFWKYGMPLITGKSGATAQPIPVEIYADAPGFTPDLIDPQNGSPTTPLVAEELCTLHGARFEAQLSSRGAGVQHLFLTDARYAHTEAGDMSTTPDVERWRSLRTLFRGEGANDQVKYDRFMWKLDRSTGTECAFSYADDEVRIAKTFTAGARPFELEVETTVTNLAPADKTHRFSIEQFAFRRNAEVKGHLGRVSPFVTELSCARGKEVTRKSRDDFKEGWFSESGVDRYVAVSNYYFAQALIPQGESGECRLLAEDWYGEGQTRDQDDAGAVYHARLSYPAKTLTPQGSASYRQIAFLGPKERDVLAHAGGGERSISDLINLGFFSPVAKVLVGFLVVFHDRVTGSWGLAIIVMTLCLRLILFPLTWKSIRTTIAMRRLKPEIDALNSKFGGDAQAKNLAMMELWRKKRGQSARRVPPPAGADADLVRDVHDPADRGRDVPYTVPVVQRPRGPRPVLHPPHRPWSVHDRPAAHRAPAGDGPGAAEDDDVPSPGGLHGHDALSAGRPRRLHADQQRARDRPAARAGAVCAT